MQCIEAPTIEEKKKLLGAPGLRGEISWFSYSNVFIQAADRAFCTYVAKCLIKKYPFMQDDGVNVSGYVSIFTYSGSIVYGCIQY